MGFFDSFPYSNQHTLNLDWLIKKQRELEEYIKQYTAVNNVSYAGVWDITKQYPQWAVVSNGDKTYMSNKPVPVGIPIDNKEYWLHLADLDPRIGGIMQELDRISKVLSKQDFVYTMAGNERGLNMWVDCVSGNDENDGLTAATPVKTLEKCFATVRAGGKNLIVNFAEPGNYYLPDDCYTISLSGLHLKGKPGVKIHTVIDWLSFYQCHCNFNNVEFINDVGQKEIYFDGCSVNLKNIKMSVPLIFYGDFVTISNCTLKSVQFEQTMANVNGVDFVNSNVTNLIQAKYSIVGGYNFPKTITGGNGDAIYYVTGGFTAISTLCPENSGFAHGIKAEPGSVISIKTHVLDQYNTLTTEGNVFNASGRLAPIIIARSADVVYI